MALTFTGSKYSGNLTAVGTLTLTDSGQSFTAGDFDQGAGVQGGQRVAVLWNNALTAFKGVALIDAASSGTVLKLLTEFLDPLTGDVVTQIVGGSADAYTISQNMADLVGGALTQNEFQFTTTDEIIWGVAADPDGITFYDENFTLLFDNALGGASGMNNEFRGGYIQFGKVLDWVSFVTSQGCNIMGDDGVNNVEMMVVTDDESKLVVAGSVIHNHRHQGSRMGSGGGGTSGNGSEAKFQIYMNCATNCNVASGPTTGQAWDANAADQRLINLDYWGTGNTGTNGSGVGVRWGDGVIIGGSYGFSREDGSIGLFGADANITHSIGPVAQAGITNLRLRVLNILQSGSKTALYRTNGTPTCAVTFINVLTDDRRAGTGVSPGTDANNNVGMDFTFEEIYTGLIQNTRLVVERDVDNVVSDSDVAGADGQALIRLLHETVTGHTSDDKFTAFAMGAWMFGFDPAVADIDESTTPVLSGTAEDLIFGGTIVQAPDLGITESTQATVAAYTDIDITDRLYDRAADWKMLTNANAQYPTIKTKLIAAEGNLAAVNVGTDLDIDSSAAAVFAVNTGTDLLTVDCAGAFDPGATFVGIKADNIQFLNNATIGDDLILTGDVTIRGAMNLTGVTINGNLIVNIAADTILNFSNVTVTGSVQNDATGNTLTINSTNGTSFGSVADAGTGNGQTNVVNLVILSVTVVDAAANAIPYATVSIQNAATDAEVSAGIANNLGVYTDSSFVYTGDLAVNVVVRKSSPGSTRYRVSSSPNTIFSTGLSVGIGLTENPIVGLIPMVGVLRHGVQSEDVNDAVVTATIDLPAGTSRKLVVAVMYYASGSDLTVSAATYDGNGMTSINSIAVGTFNEVFLYRHDIPDGDDGAKVISFTLSAAVNIKAIAFAVLDDVVTGAQESADTDSGNVVTSNPSLSLNNTTPGSFSVGFGIVDDLDGPTATGDAANRVRRSDVVRDAALQSVTILVADRASAGAHNIGADFGSNSKTWVYAGASFAKN